MIPQFSIISHAFVRACVCLCVCDSDAGGTFSLAGMRNQG